MQMPANSEQKRILVINYHRIDQEDGTIIERSERPFCIKRSIFTEQISLLKRNKIPVVSLENIHPDRLNLGLSVAITFDDGNSSDYSFVYPYLLSQELPATFFLISKNIKPGSSYLKHIQKMAENGFTFGSHGHTHLDLSRLTASEQKYELEYSRRLLGDTTRSQINFFAFPYGRYNRKLVNSGLKAGYKFMFTTDFKLNSPDPNNSLIHRWNIKRGTSLSEFEKVLTSMKYVKKKVCISAIKKAGKKVLGGSIADYLNEMTYPDQ